MIRLERNDARTVRWLCNVLSEDRISAEELRTRLKLKSMRECLQDRRLQWLCYLEGMKESALNVEPSRLPVVSPEGDCGKHGMR